MITKLLAREHHPDYHCNNCYSKGQVGIKTSVPALILSELDNASYGRSITKRKVATIKNRLSSTLSRRIIERLLPRFKRLIQKLLGEV